MHRRAVLAATTGLASAVAGCLQVGRRGEPPAHDVGMGADFFRPERLTVSAGDEVVWLNTGARAHTVTAYENGIPDEAEYFATGGFDTEEAAQTAWFGDRTDNGALYPGDTFAHAFTIPGEYDYYCVPHVQMGMEGTIVVE